MSDNSDAVRDAFFEAAFIPELMPAALDTIAALGDCESAVLIAADGTRQPVWEANDRGRGATETFVRDGWAPRNVQAARTYARNEPRFFSDYDLFSPDEVETEPFYRDFLRPNGLAWGCGTVINGATENRIVVSVFRPYERGPLAIAQLRRLNALRPSLARAAFVASRLRLEQARAATATLAAIGLPAAALDRAGRLRHANSLLEPMMPGLIQDNPDRLRVSQRNADSLFLGALHAGQAGNKTGITIPVARADQAPVILNMVPIVGHAHDIFSSVEWLLVATPVAPKSMPDPGILQALFDLTPAESRIAKAIGDGATVNDIAHKARLSPETVRKQLKAAMAKTGVNRQSELVRLIGSVQPLGK
ncbi:MAG: helix-turn-helix transcriptional regulator [Rhizobiales bacterium]|nr:helix-turn-helix transcriptional regulator [Hyphomicrobiales bacterium]